ncbi:hypothetical protein [Photobacterium sp. Hal280]
MKAHREGMLAHDQQNEQTIDIIYKKHNTDADKFPDKSNTS